MLLKLFVQGVEGDTEDEMVNTAVIPDTHEMEGTTSKKAYDKAKYLYRKTIFKKVENMKSEKHFENMK